MWCVFRILSAALVVALLGICALGGPVATLPGDCDLDWSVDLADLGGLPTCLSGPHLPWAGECACYDLDDDEDVDLQDFAALQTTFTGTQVLRTDLTDDADDGTEVDDTTWWADGYSGSEQNRVGLSGAESYDVGLRFHLPQVRQGEAFVYARLVTPAISVGQVDSQATLRIVGIDQDSPAGFDVARPSQSPKTEASSDWNLAADWPYVEPSDADCTPLHRYSPDIAPIMNEILSRPDWGSGPEGKTLALVIEDDGCTDTNFLAFADYR